jgi:hypothetical protein
MTKGNQQRYYKTINFKKNTTEKLILEERLN